MKVLYIRTSTLEKNFERQFINTTDDCQLSEVKCSVRYNFLNVKRLIGHKNQKYEWRIK